MKSERILLLCGAVALTIGCFLILKPFLPAMLWAAILVYCLWPVYLRANRTLPPAVSAALITLAVAGLVLVPLVHLALVAAKGAKDGRFWVQDAMQNGLPPAPAFIGKIPLFGGFLSDFWNNSADDLGGTASSLQPVLAAIAHSGFRLVLGLTHGLVGTVVALLIAYFFFLSGAQIIARLRLLLVRIMNEARVEHLLTLVAGTVRGVVFGILGTAAMQGVLFLIGFEVARAPQALLLAGIAGLLSVVPMGAIVIWLPLCLFLVATSHVLMAVLLAAYCFVFIGGADSVVRPWLISRGASLPYALTLIGVLGGAIAFGALGIFLGPVLLALGLAVAEEFAGQPRGAWRE